jgi:hypothetical protein
MVKQEKFKLPEGLKLNYDNLFVIPVDDKVYKALYGDEAYTFEDSEIKEVCARLNVASCKLSVEDIRKVVEKLNQYNNTP